MRRKLSLIVAFVGVLGLIGFAPAAQASHDDTDANRTDWHEDEPSPPERQVGGQCLVQGEVSVGNFAGTGGVHVDAPTHNHYKFQDTAISCMNLPVGDDMSDFARSFAVEAAGGTDGPADDNKNHGETTDAGWSHGSCYADNQKNDDGCDPPANSPKGSDLDDLYNGSNVNSTNGCENCGEIEVRSLNAQLVQDGVLNSVSTDNVVMFSRIESVVTAWGALKDPSGTLGSTLPQGQIVCFLADLEFTPINGDGGVTKGFDEALLSGTASVWISETGDKGECGIENNGGKK